MTNHNDDHDTGLPKESWAVDYGAGMNMLNALKMYHRNSDKNDKSMMHSNDKRDSNDKNKDGNDNKQNFSKWNRVEDIDIKNVTGISTRNNNGIIESNTKGNNIKNLDKINEYNESNIIENDRQAKSQNNNTVPNFHFVLLSAFCCGKPLLQFQFAKLKLEENLKNINSMKNVDKFDKDYFESNYSHLDNKIKDRYNDYSIYCNNNLSNYIDNSNNKYNHIKYSIVRPTAYFKSLDGQIETARKGD